MSILYSIFTAVSHSIFPFGKKHSSQLEYYPSGSEIRSGAVARAIVVLLFLGLSYGCASGSPQLSESSTDGSTLPNIETSSDMATVVFLRPSALLAGARKLSLFDITDGAQFLGILPNGTKTTSQITPGVRKFMGTIAGSTGVMEAEIEAGKIYYVKVYAAQLSPLLPTRQEASIGVYWSKTKAVTITEADIQWDRNNRNSIEKHALKAHNIWNNLSEDRQQKYRLNPNDGI